MPGPLPEGILALGAVAVALVGRLRAGRLAVGPIGIVAVVAAGALLVLRAPEAASAYRVVLLLSALVALLAPRDPGSVGVAFPAMVLLATAGLGAAASAGDLIVLAAGLEAAGLAATRLAGGRRRAVAASGLLWFGLAMIHGLTGSTSLADLTRLYAGRASVAEGAALLLVLSGLSLRLAAFPLHGWLTESPRRRPAAIGFLATAGIAGTLGVLDRLLTATGAPAPMPGGLMPGPDALPAALATVLGVLAVVAGSLAAVRAERADGADTACRYIGGLAVLQGGLAVLALATGSPEGRRAAAFAALLLVPVVQGGLLAVRGSRGGGLPLCVATALLLFSAAGLPPTGGFAARVVVVDAIVRAGFPVLAIAVTLGALLPAAALPRHLRRALDRRHGPAPELRLLAIVVAAAVAALALGLAWDPWLRLPVLP